MDVSTRTLAGLAAVLAAMLALVLAPLGSAATAGPATYSDPTGDAKSAPDISKVTIELDAATGGIRFDIQFGGPEALANDGAVLVAIDADRNGTTGDHGADYLLGVVANGVGLLKWNGSDMAAFSHQPTSVVRTPGDIAVSICSCDIGTQTFDFVALGVRGADIDAAPDEGGTFPIPEHTVKIQSFVYSAKPLVPKAGKRFTVKPLGLRLADTNEVVAADTVSCAAKLAGKQLKGSGQGGCSWLLPKKARGKNLVVVVSVSYEGQSETFSQTFKVR